MKKLLSFFLLFVASLFGMAQEDYTRWILNPNFTNATDGSESLISASSLWWTNGNSSYVGGYIFPNYVADANGVSHTCWNNASWNSGALDLDIYQNITRLPAGIYTLECLAKATNYTNDQRAYITTSDKTVYSLPLNTNVWTKLTTDKIIVTNGNIKIGFSSSQVSTDGGYKGEFYCTHFKLLYYGNPTESDSDELKTDLSNLINKCNQVTTEFPYKEKLGIAISDAQAVFNNVSSTFSDYYQSLQNLNTALINYNSNLPINSSVDYTSYISYPNFNTATSLADGTSSNGTSINWVNGSTSIKTSGGSSNFNFQACYPNRNGVSYSGWERNCWDMTTTNKDSYNDIHQNITGLPNGYYNVSCLATLEKSNNLLLTDQISDQHVYLSSSNGIGISPIYSSGTSPVWITQTTDKVKVTDGRLTIGYNGSAKMVDGSYSTSNKAGHFFITSFQLNYYGTDDNNAPILNEATDYTPTATSDVQVKMTRTLNSNKWNTICLPYSMTKEQIIKTFGSDVKIAQFSNIIGTNLQFTTVTETKANTPYIIMVPSDITTFITDNATIEVPSGDMKVTEPTNTTEFIGKYESDNIPRDAFYISDNTIYQSDGTTQIKPFQGYFISTTMIPSKEMNINIDGITTYIENVKRNNTEGKDNVYNLNGQLLKTGDFSLKGLSKDVYIKNGKKILVK